MRARTRDCFWSRIRFNPRVQLRPLQAGSMLFSPLRIAWHLEETSSTTSILACSSGEQLTQMHTRFIVWVLFSFTAVHAVPQMFLCCS